MKTVSANVIRMRRTEFMSNMNTYPKERRFKRITLDVDSAEADDPDFF